MTLEINKETVTSNTITVSWEPIRGAAYNVSINGEEMEKNVSMADKESFSFNNLSSNSHYNISVIAVNSKNRNSTLGEGALEVLTKENLDSFKNDLYAPLIKNKSDD
ncbi:MAG: fibronectin type III domain-containing protein [Nanoarchaeota archaeon]